MTTNVAESDARSAQEPVLVNEDEFKSPHHTLTSNAGPNGNPEKNQLIKVMPITDEQVSITCF